MTQSSSGVFNASKTASHTFFWASRRKRWQTELGLSNRSGKLAQAAPVRKIYTTALKNSRLSRPVTPQFVTLPDNSGATNAHWRSVISWRCMEAYWCTER